MNPAEWKDRNTLGLTKGADFKFRTAKRLWYVIYRERGSILTKKYTQAHQAARAARHHADMDSLVGVAYQDVLPVIHEGAFDELLAKAKISDLGEAGRW